MEFATTTNRNKLQIIIIGFPPPPQFLEY